MNEDNADVVEVDETDTPQEDTATSQADETEVKAESKTDETETPEEKPDKPKPRRNRRSESQRIAQLTAQLRERERELAEKQAELTSKPEPTEAPKREDFDDYEAYIEARAEHKAVQAAESRLREAEKARRAHESQVQQSTQQEAFNNARDDLLDRGAEKYDDFVDVTTKEDLKISPVMADALLTSKKGDDMWYHLGKNPEVAEKISGMPPLQQAIELGKLEERLSGGKTASNAPRPTKPVSSRGNSGNALSDNMNVKDWMRKRTEEARKNSF